MGIDTIAEPNKLLRTMTSDCAVSGKQRDKTVYVHTATSWSGIITCDNTGHTAVTVPP